MQLLTAFLSGGSIIDLDGTFFFQFAIFWVAFLVLRKLVFHPIIAVIEAREEAIDGARQKARDLEKDSADREKEFATKMRSVRLGAGEERDKLRDEAKHLEDSILDKVRSETEKQMAEAHAKMASEAAKVRSEISAQTPILAKQIAAKLLQREVQ
ncbi:MAG: ATP synthase F0 subunit B [Myxococcota bacterium]